MGKKLNIASAILGGVMAFSSCKDKACETEEIDQGKIEWCTSTTRDRIADICDDRCSEKLFTQAVEMGTNDCIEGTVPEVGTSEYECYIEGLGAAISAHIKKGRFIGQEEGYKNLGFRKCLRDKEL